MRASLVSCVTSICVALAATASTAHQPSGEENNYTHAGEIAASSRAGMVDSPVRAQVQSEEQVLSPADKEQIWVEISDAIESLNDVVGDKMFLDLRRKNQSEMEVRLDAGFWQRVRYQTRVDLKNDISNIWHLYVKQYYDGGFSSVHFIDDKTDSTIDIFTQTR